MLPDPKIATRMANYWPCRAWPDLIVRPLSRSPALYIARKTGAEDKEDGPAGSAPLLGQLQLLSIISMPMRNRLIRRQMRKEAN